ncbi:transforming protein RhoA precursor [Mycena sanguinolenta]|nr:transforming protein RhoA precursor [Mycena sanguinolenta]
MLPEKPTRMVIMIVGDISAGKTSMLIKYAMGIFPTHYMPLIIDSYSAEVEVKGKRYSLHLNDTGGEEPFWSPRSDIFLICFRVDSPTSFEGIRDKWVPQVRHYSDAPFVIVGTQIDLRDDSVETSETRPLVSTEEAETRIRTRGCYICRVLVADREWFR